MFIRKKISSADRHIGDPLFTLLIFRSPDRKPARTGNLCSPRRPCHSVCCPLLLFLFIDHYSATCPMPFQPSPRFSYFLLHTTGVFSVKDYHVTSTPLLTTCVHLQIDAQESRSWPPDLQPLIAGEGLTGRPGINIRQHTSAYVSKRQHTPR